MKATQPNPGGGRKEGTFLQNAPQEQYCNAQGKNGLAAQSQSVLANYTLPGVISYLTSEFTNLERFKIMTNLEKSEMKYKIQQLTSELNSVRFVNEKQALRIKLLEEKLEKTNSHIFCIEGEKPGGHGHGDTSGLRSPTNDVSDHASDDALDDDSKEISPEIPHNRVGNGPQKPSQNGHLEKRKVADSDTLASSEIPHVNLELLRNSRQSLNKSIREIVSLLEPPSGLDFLEAHAGRSTCPELDDLLDNSKRFSFEPAQETREYPKETVFGRHTLSRDDLFLGQKIMFETDVKPPAEALQGVHPNLKHDFSWADAEDDHVTVGASDAETVTIDEPDLIGILLNGTDLTRSMDI